GNPGLLLDCVHHYNQALPAVADPEARLRIAELNLAAARASRETAAFAPAMDYLIRAMECLPGAPWETCHGLALEIHAMGAEAASLSGRYDLASQWSGMVLKNAKTLLEKVRIWRLLLHSQVANGRFAEAVDLGLTAMKAMGREFSGNPGKGQILWEYLLTSHLLKKTEISELKDIPELSDPVSRAFLGLCFDTMPPAFLARPNLTPILVFYAIRFCIEHGMAPESSTIFASYGFVLAGYLRKPAQARRMGKLALALLARFQDNRFASQTLYIANVSCLSWHEPMAERLPGLQESERAGRVTGIFSWASFACFGKSYFAFFSGKPLAELDREMEKTVEEVGLMSQHHMKSCIRILRQTVLNLITPGPDPVEMEGPAYYESRREETLKGHDRVLVHSVLDLQKAILALFFRRPDQALALCDKALEARERMAGSPPLVMALHVQCLACLGVLNQGKTGGTRFPKRILKKSLKELSFWAREAPVNHGHRLVLAQAELARNRRKLARASDLYERAAQQALENGFIQDAALGREIFAEALLSAGNREGAARQLSLARKHYADWGALAKVKDLEVRHEGLFQHLQGKDLP
ncbi:MAG: hypothetical protein AB1921_12500, partial [Thermodesulfobacteriota bacterium]